MTEPRRINLALQGGGAHGAFTWGVLDRILEDEEIEIAGISGTSAGALNGAALKAGMIRDGRRGARENLAWLWAQVGAVGDLKLAGWLNTYFPGPMALARMAGAGIPFSPASVAAQFFSPYDFGPIYRNPLERVVRNIEFGHVCSASGPALYVSATNVRTGKIRVFTGDELTPEAILASACLPTVFQAIEIYDPSSERMESYWDGGYSGNPALFPLFDPALPDDIVIVNINPIERADVPETPAEIQNRINEVSFNSSLLRELRAIAFVKRLIAEGSVRRGAMKDVLVHMIADDDLMTELSVITKLNANPYLLFTLKEAGRRAADSFLARHRSDLNRTGTVDLVKAYS